MLLGSPSELHMHNGQTSIVVCRQCTSLAPHAHVHGRTCCHSAIRIRRGLYTTMHQANSCVGHLARTRTHVLKISSGTQTCAGKIPAANVESCTRLSSLPLDAHVQGMATARTSSTGLRRAWLLREQPIGSEPLTAGGCPVLSL